MSQSAPRAAVDDCVPCVVRFARANSLPRSVLTVFDASTLMNEWGPSGRRTYVYMQVNTHECVAEDLREFFSAGLLTTGRAAGMM